MSPVWLYVPAIGKILQLVQVTISIGLCTVDSLMQQPSPLAQRASIHHSYYGICKRSFQEAQPWTGRLTQLGWLIIPGERDTTHLHELFTAMSTSSAHISAITPTYCRANARGVPMPTWLLQELLNASVEFFYAPFPDGYPPPTPTPAQQLTYEALPFAHSSVLNNMLSDVFLTPASFELTPTELQELDCGYNYWGLSTITSLNGIDDSARPLLDEMGLWVGEHQALFRVSQMEVQHLVTNNFLTVLHLVDKTYEEILEEPVNIKFANGETIAAGWPVFHLAKAFNNSKAELRKVVKGAMSPYTRFIASWNEMITRITHFVLLFNSGKRDDVYRAISELINEQVFLELVWALLFHPISKLADGQHKGQLADLFPEEVFSNSNCLAQKPVCNLMTLLYHSMVIILKEKHTEQIDYYEPEDMNEILMSALEYMASNVLSIAPKTGLPRTMMERNGRKRFRNMTDIVPIEIQPIGNPCGEVPNSGGFSSTKSLRFVWDVPVSYFTTHPAAIHM
ncbi:hypothetical protein BDR06DRAFT_971601 [Suillus hirtellus]|nr:hypothetical protein BDR06DRAFT_971601 [Suillus hirtellus]